jgi:hypothetical protein
VLGICLKRYAVSNDGKATRRGTHIDIPIELGLPHFIEENTTRQEESSFGKFKLSLQSVVCHRGNSVQAGHYIALVRGRAPTRSGNDVGNGYTENKTWMLFDDLAKERITYVNIGEALKKESPYLLFYQVLPLAETPRKTDDDRGRPPSYASEATDSAAAGVDGAMSRSSTLDKADQGQPSLEASATGSSDGRASPSRGRRPSLAFTDSLVDLGKDQPTETSENGGPSTSLDVPRRTSRTIRRSKSRPNSLNGASLLSASWITFTGKLSAKDSPEANPAGAAPIDASDGAERGRAKKIKKEKDKSRSKSGGQRHLAKRQRNENPERECTIM